MRTFEFIVDPKAYTMPGTTKENTAVPSYEDLARFEPEKLIEIAEKNPRLFDQIAAAYYDKIVQELAMGQTP